MTWIRFATVKFATALEGIRVSQAKLQVGHISKGKHGYGTERETERIKQSSIRLK